MHIHRVFQIAAVSLLVGASPHAQTTQSTFASGTEGWSLVLLPNSPETEGYTNVVAGPPLIYSPGNGNPGGSVYWGTLAANHFVYFSAPPEYLGQRIINEGGSISFELRHTQFGSGQSSAVAGVVLVGGGRALVIDTGADATGVSDWASKTVLLTASAGWHFETLSGAQPTPEEFRTVLSNVTDLYIRAEYFWDEDDCYLDNVIMRAPATNAPPVPLAAEAAAQISWASESNRLYLLQWASRLDTNTWISLGPPVTGNGRANYFCDPIGGRGQRFYRVVTLE